MILVRLLDILFARILADPFFRMPQNRHRLDDDVC